MSSQQEITIRPIGIIHSSYTAASGTPVQGLYAPEATGSVEIYAPYHEALRDLEGFDRIWLLYYFDRASADALIVTPYLDAEQRGVYATRSPARPNHIGFSCVRLLSVEDKTLHISEVDILDGTPLIDIKPCVPAFDHRPVERQGWFEGRLSTAPVADNRFER